MPEEKRRDSRSMYALSSGKETALFCLGIVMVASSVVVFMVHAMHGHQGLFDIIVHVLFLGVGLLLTVPRRLLHLLERLPAFKWFGK